MEATDKQTDIEAKTGFGNYILKQLYQVAVTFGGVAGGAYTGLLAAKPFFKNAVDATISVKEWSEIPVLSKLPGLKVALNKKQMQYGVGIGALAGGIASSMILGYGHWKKIKQAQLQVDEITKNVSDIEVFKKTDPELKAENERLWTELKKQEGATSMVDKMGATHHTNWQDKAAEHAQAATEVSR